MTGLATFGTIAVTSAFGANPYVCGGLIFSALLLLWKGMSWIVEYANKNPITATMEGSEIIIHQQLKSLSQRTKSKARIRVRKKDLMPDPEQPPPSMLGSPDSEIAAASNVLSGLERYSSILSSCCTNFPLYPDRYIRALAGQSTIFRRLQENDHECDCCLAWSGERAHAGFAV